MKKEIQELKIRLMETYGLKGKPSQRKNIRKEIARLKTKENENVNRVRRR